jgi:hypothetical protein
VLASSKDESSPVNHKWQDAKERERDQTARRFRFLTNRGVRGPRNFLSVKVFRMDLEADFKRLFVVGFVC